MKLESKYISIREKKRPENRLQKSTSSFNFCFDSWLLNIYIPITKLQGVPYISPGLFIGCRNTDQITSLARLFFLLNLWKEHINLNWAKIGAWIDTK